MFIHIRVIVNKKTIDKLELNKSTSFLRRKKSKEAIKKWKNKEVEIKKWKKAKKDKKHVDKVKGSWYYIRAPSEKALGSIFEN